MACVLLPAREADTDAKMPDYKHLGPDGFCEIV